MEDIEFLSIEDIFEIHHDQIQRYGGSDGIRNENGLASAVEQPFATFNNEFLHPNIWMMAAAYIFHISQNHPFIDGNKRTALASGLVFLDLNGYDILDPKESLYDLMIEVVSGKSSKQIIAEHLKLLWETFTNGNGE